MDKLKLATDEDFDNDILHALIRERPELDIERVQDTEFYSAKDPDVLEWLAREGRVLLTHDVNTMPNFAYQRVKAGLPMPGIIVVQQGTPVGRAMQDILIALEASFEGEFENQVLYLPF